MGDETGPQTRLTAQERRLAEAGTLRNVYRYRCPVCGALTLGRRPAEPSLLGDCTLMFPRRHKSGGDACPGNTEYAIEVRLDPATLRSVEETPLRP